MTRNLPLRAGVKIPGVGIAVGALVLATLLLSGCPARPLPRPVPDSTAASQRAGSGVTPDVTADETVAALTTALTTGKLNALPVVGDASAGPAAAKDYATIMSGMDGLLPQVVAQPVVYAEGGVATVTLDQRYTVGGNAWQFSSQAQLNLVRGRWMVAWRPSIVHPDLTELARMRHVREQPARAPILGANGLALMEERDVYEVGIDKQNLAAARWAGAAKALATLLKIDAAAYQRRVLAAGPKAFVPALTMRQSEIPARASEIGGVGVVARLGVLAPSRTFARSILGTVAEATPERIKAGKGAVWPGDLVGMAGLQLRYDEQLRGKAGHRVLMVERSNATAAPGSTTQPPPETTLFEKEMVGGTPLQLSMNIDAQMRAEQVLASVKPIAAMVVVKPSTGEIVAAATSPAAGENAFATFGRYAPGSTFKVATALALVRKGYSAGSPVDCPATVTVNGRTFKNYNDFPATMVGSMSLQTALATSCNTAFITSAPRLDADDLAGAAGSLGIGVDYDAGFPSFYGSTPPAPDLVTKAANTIGQGQIEASPMAMAGLAATVASGRTTIPWLVDGKRPVSKAAPLTPHEAAQLRSMTQAVVTEGSGRGLRGLMLGGKTGTAEFGPGNPPKTHAWMIAWKGDLAIAVMVHEGQSGSRTALPLIKAYLS